MSSQTGKDVIYIDIDDEITAIIDKVRGSEQRIVALVLPKRATVFQSIVNMKLLKRTADDAKKHLVLITSENGLLPLAGAVGVYVAKTLQSKPEIPDVPGGLARHDGDEEESVRMDEDTALDKTRPVGEYAGAAAAGLDDDQPIDFDNDKPETPAAARLDAKKDRLKKNKRLAIPDFNKFRLWLVVGAVALVALIFFWYMGFVAMPRAAVTVKTDSEAIETNLDITFDTEAKEVDAEEGIIPAKVQTTQKTASQQVPATGQKDKGTKATGAVTIKNCGAEEITIPAGTAVSANGLTFITQSRLDLDDGKFGNACNPSGKHIGTVDVVAQQAGAQYNLEPRADYKVAGQGALVTANGSQMQGGTSLIVKTVAQADIDSAKQKIVAADANAIKLELSQALSGQGYYAVDGTFANAEPEITTSAAVGDETEAITVTAKTTYTMSGVKKSDLEKIIANAVNKEIDDQKQAILDFGLDDAEFKIQNSQGSKMLVTLSNTSIAGSDIDLADIKQQIAGKKANDAKRIIGDYPGVTDVTVDYSPFWVSSIPNKTSKITVSVEKPSVKDAR